MFTKYRFNILGSIRTKNVFPIKVADYFIEFVMKNEEIIAVDIFEPTNLKDLPKITTQQNKLDSIEMRGNTLLGIWPFLKLAEGLLSPFGLREIDLDNYTIKWIPANDEEKELLEIYEFSFGYEDGEERNDIIPFEIVASSFIAGFTSNKYEVSLSFYRKGKLDMASRSYIDAFYDFYFVLETMFAEGKTKNYQIEKNFLISKDLKTAIEKSKSERELIKHLSSEVTDAFDYIGSSSEEIIKHLTNKRGFLHHHNPRHPDAWKPDLQKNYHLDAAFIMQIAHNLIWGKVMGYIQNEKVAEILNESYRMSR